MLTTGAVNDQHYGARWLTDLEATWHTTPKIDFAVGANNLFDVYPEKSTIIDTSGSQYYASNSPFAFYGGFYYARATVRF